MSPTEPNDRSDERLADELLEVLQEKLEPGGEEAERRIARRVAVGAQPGPSPLRWLVPAGAMLAAAAIVAVTILRPGSLPEVAPGSSGLAPFEAGVELVARGTSVDAALPGGAGSVHLDDDGALRRLADGPAGELLFELDRGQAAFDVEPGAVSGLTVAAGPVGVSVIGTLFSVEREETGVAVDVTRGRVRVVCGSRHLFLGGGEHWTTEMSACSEELADGTGEPAALQGGTGTTDGPAPVEPLVETGEDPGTTQERSGIELSAEEQEYLALQAAVMSGEATEGLLARIDRYLANAPDGPMATEIRALQVETLAEAGQYREAHDHAQAFCADYADSPWVTQMLWVQATMARDRLHDCGLALPAYRQLVDRIGDGPRAAEANYMRAVCAEDLGLDDEARAAVRRSLALDPGGKFAERARELERALGGAGDAGETARP